MKIMITSTSDKQAVAGFTLIELVIVITIIGILSAVALPRFTAMQRDARVAKAQSLYGAVRSASTMAHARCLLDLSQSGGGCTTSAGSANMEGAAIAMVNQYPAMNTSSGACTAGTRAFTGIVQAAQITDCSDGVVLSSAADPTTIQISGATTAANCQISYTQAAAGGSPAILVDTSGC